MQDEALTVGADQHINLLCVPFLCSTTATLCSAVEVV